MKLSWPKKILLYSFVITGVAVSLTAVITVRTAAGLWQQEFRERNRAFSQYTSLDVLRIFGGSFTGTLDPAGQADLKRLTESNRDLVGVMILTESGRALFSSLDGELVSDLTEAWPEGLAEAVTGLVRDQEMVTRVRTVGPRTYLDVLSPVAGQGGVRPIAIRYVYDFSSLDAKIGDLVKRVIMGSILLVLLVAALSTILSGFLVRPVRVLTGSARRIAAGETDHRITLSTGDEIEELSRQFNSMVDSLQEKQRQLEETNRELLQANEQLRELQGHLVRSERLAALGQLSAGLSHELDNPVGVILGYSELLAEELPADHPAVEYARILKEEAKRCKRIISGLLDFARPGAGHSQRLDLATLLAEMTQHLSSQRPFRDVRIVCEPAPDHAPVFLDPDGLRQVLVNLALNAVQATGGGGTVTFGLERRRHGERDGYQVIITDTGPGIAPGQEEKIFEPFYTTKAKGQGTGLGLSICRKLMEEAGGWVRAESGPGGRLLLWLPSAGGEGGGEGGKDRGHHGEPVGGGE